MLLFSPNRKIFYYSAMDNYITDGQPFAFEYLSIIQAQKNWRGKLENYKIDTVYLPPNYPLIIELAKDKNWQKIGEKSHHDSH